MEMPKLVLSSSLGIGSGDGADGGNLVLGGDFLGGSAHGIDDHGDGLVDATTNGDGVGASCHVAQALVDDDLSEQGCGGGAVTHEVVGLSGDLLHELGAHVLDGILELDFLGDGNAVIGDGGRAVGTLQRNVTALGAHGGGDCVSQGVDALGELGTCVGAENDVLSHYPYLHSSKGLPPT